MNAPRLGDTVDLPWWIVPFSLPPLLVIAGAVVTGSVPARALALVASLILEAVLLLVAVRVDSRNLQSVWISAAYAVWVFPALAWAVSVRTG